MLQTSLLKKRFRPVGAEQIEKVAFVDESMSPDDGKHPPWPALYRAWCKKTKKRHDGNWRAFARDYGRTRAAFMPPQFPISRKGMSKSELRAQEAYDRQGEHVRRALREIERNRRRAQRTKPRRAE